MAFSQNDIQASINAGQNATTFLRNFFYWWVSTTPPTVPTRWTSCASSEEIASWSWDAERV